MYRVSYSGGLRMPELGLRDRLIFGLGIAVLVIFEVLMIPAFLILENRLPFVEQAVVAYSNRAGILGVASAFLLMGLVISMLIGGRMRKFPIFGIVGVTYGEPEWNPVYPLLMPTRNAPEQVRRAVREGRQLVCIFTVIALIAALIFGVSLLSGNRLCEDGSIQCLWGFGWEVEQYAPEDVEQVTTSIRRTGSSRSIMPSKYEIVLYIQTSDDLTHAFYLRDFRKDTDASSVEQLKQMLSCYADDKWFVQNKEHLNDLIYDQQYSTEDQKVLLWLFG